ncbi:MAG: sarcosine oxidase subunit gamma [Candidatus Puniceispirillum sp.]|nr:sarcosine oxidase subunit gamma [Candidatus Puniceispirillum sp.]
MANNAVQIHAIQIPGRTPMSGRDSVNLPNPDGGDIGLHMRELKHLGKLNIRGGKAINAIVNTATGCNLPRNANSYVSAGERHVVWLGPDEFLILCEAGKESELHGIITSEIKNGQHAAITNVTDSLCAFHLSGPALLKVLAKGCALDLYPSQFKAGNAAQTLLSHAAVTLMAMPDGSMTILCRTSFAAYLLDWMTDAALEYGFSFKG